MSSTMASSPTARFSESDMDADVYMGDDGATAAPSSPVSSPYDGDPKSRLKVTENPDVNGHEIFNEPDASTSGEDQAKLPEEDLQTRLTRLDILLEKSTVYSRILGERMNKARRDHKTAADAVPTGSPQGPKAKAKNKTGRGRKSHAKLNTETGSKRGRHEVDDASDDEAESTSSKRLRVNDVTKDIDGEPLFKQPDAITGATLKDYQLVGVAWLASLWENGVNGILADEMGLGKTLQTIAFLAYVRERAPNNTLIVCPLSVLHNWVDEFEKFAPSIPVCMYHGTPAERAELRNSQMRKADNDLVSPKKGDLHKKKGPTETSQSLTKGAVRDKGSTSNTRSTQKSKVAHKKPSVKAKGRPAKKSAPLPTRRSKRYLVTQVNYNETDGSDCQDDAGISSTYENAQDKGEEGETDEMDVLATPKDEKGRSDSVAEDHSGEEETLSRETGHHSGEADKPATQDEGSRVKNSFPIVLTTYEMIIKDRQHLAKYNWNFIIVDEGHRLKNMDCKLVQEIKKYDSANRLILTGTPLHNNLAELWSLLNFILPDIFQDLDSFQQWFNLPSLQGTLPNGQSNSVISKLHGILKPFLLRRLKADVDHSLPPKKEYVIYAPLSERQRGIYDAVLSGVLRGYLINDIQSKQDNVDNGGTDNGRHMRKKQRISYKVDGDDDEWFDNLEHGEESKPQTATEEDLATGRQFHYKNTVKQVNSMKLQNTVMQLRKVCSHPFLFDWPSDPKTREPVVNEQLVNASGKMMVLDRLLDELFRRGHKVLLFSQFTTMLDIIEEWAFSFKQWSTCRIDGSTGPTERRAEMRRFQGGGDDPEAPRLFLLSTRAGGLGINLTAADTVIFYDQDWNPQIDLQAMDRAHRIGQTKPVLIFRLVSAHTVETKIMQKANEKRKLEALVIAKGKFRMPGSTSRAKGETVAEMAASLLKLEGEKIEVVSSSDAGKAKVISDADLDKLLDRSPEVFNVRGQGWTSGSKSKSTEDKQADVAFEVFQAPVDECNDGLAAIMGEEIE